jgi:hypothetical protein
MAFTTVLRIENARGKGPYNAQLQSECWAKIKAQHSYTRPNPTRPGEPWEHFPSGAWRDYHVCGFLDRRQLNAWFSQAELQLLAELGFTINRYLVAEENVLLGQSQITFVKVYARRIK